MLDKLSTNDISLKKNWTNKMHKLPTFWSNFTFKIYDPF